MANWYVSQKVATSGAGTSLAVAFKTIAEAITAAAATDDLIYVYDGVYNESVTINKSLTIIGIGNVIVDGSNTLEIGLNITVSNSTVKITNIESRNFTTSFKSTNTVLQLQNCKFYGDVILHPGGTALFKNNVFKGTLTLIASTINMLFEKNIFIDATFAHGETYTTYSYSIKNNIFLNCAIKLNRTINYFKDNCIYNSSISFVAGTPATVANIAELIAAYTSQKGTPPSTTQGLASNIFTEPIFNNSAKGNYTLPETSQLAANINHSHIGAYNIATNIICKDSANAGDCDIYNISTDLYGLGIFGGKTNVGAIDNTNEKLYRTSVGANNWGVFVANCEFMMTQIVKRWLGFGGMLGSLGQTSKNTIDYPYNYQIDVLVKWSDTLSKAALLAETSIPFVRFKLRPNESNYYVNNAGALVGDGEQTYLSLVNSSDGGSGSLVPTKIVAKSMVFIVILKDL